MAPQDILRQLKMKPFKPFRLHVLDGTSYDVVDPFMARVELTQLWVGVKIDEETGLPLKSVYLAPNRVSRLEPLVEDEAPGSSSESSNGRG